MNSRLLHLAVVAALAVNGIVAQDANDARPNLPTLPPGVLPGTQGNPPPAGAVPAAGSGSAPAGSPFPALPELPTRRRSTNAPAVSTNLPSSLPRSMRPTNPASTTTAPPPGAPGVRPPGPPAPGQAGKATEEDKAQNEATRKALREQLEAGGEGVIKMFKLKNEELNRFLDQTYAEAVGRTVLRAQGLPQVQISVDTQTELTNAELVQMFDTILALNGITMIPTGDKFVTAVPVAQALQEGAPFSNQPVDKYPEASQFVTHVVQLKHAAIEEVVPTVTPFAKNPQGIVALASTKTLVLRDYAINVKRMLEVIAKIDIEVEEDYQLEVIPIRYGKVDEIYSTLTSVIGGGGVSATPGGGTAGGGVGGLGSAGGIGNRRGTAGSGVNGFNNGLNNGVNQFGTGNTVNNRLGANRLGTQQSGIAGQAGSAVNTGSFQSRFNNLSRANGGSAYGGLSELLQTVSITADQRSNSLIVYGNKKDIARLKEVLTKVDTLLPQVLVEAIIMEVNLSDGWNYGISAAQRTAQFGNNANNRGGGVINNPNGAPIGTGSDFLRQLGRNTTTIGTNVVNGVPSTSGAGMSYFAQIGQNWDLAISAIAADSRVNVIQRPRVITSHATPGSFFVGSEVPFVSGSFFGGGTFGNSQSITRQQVGVGLNVTPFITPDNLVVMQIDQNVDNLGASLDLGNNLSAPTTQTRSASSFVTVRDKDAVLLGGYINSSTDRQKSGVPLLKDIPLLGAAFSRRSQSSTRTELMILIRPSILATPADAGAVADEERQRLPGVRVAEQEFEANERREAIKAKKATDRLK